MSQVVPFPQRMHEEFGQLVLHAVEKAARDANLLMDDYVTGVYNEGLDPVEFSDEKSLQHIYRRFSTLIEDAIQSVKGKPLHSEASKTYLCYRMYLHSMTEEKDTMQEEDAITYLSNALREYFYSKGKMLEEEDEKALLMLIERAAYQASEPDAL